MKAQKCEMLSTELAMHMHAVGEIPFTADDHYLL